MKKKISNQYFSLCISSRRMIFVFIILLFAFQSILHAEIQNGSFDFDGRLRDYMVYLPTNYTGSVNFPLVIHLHSGGWTAQQDMDYIKLNQVADPCGFIVVYPSAIDKAWNSGGRPAPDVDDVGFINALIDIMSDHYSIDLERIYACGYSRGGFMAYTLACQLSHRIAAIASVSGVLSTSTAESCNPVRTVPVLHIHGTGDAWVPINGGSGIYSADQTLSYWTNFNDCVQTNTTILPDLDPTDGCTVEKTTYTDCSDNCNVVYYKVINGGHTWPGAGPPGYSAGRTTQDINASVEIWNFFKNYKLVTNRAWNPHPAYGASHFETWAILSWGIGAGAVSHNVYFGENFEDVNNSTDSTFQGNQTETSFTVGLAGCPYPDGLAFGTTYYWRIDEVNDLDPNSPYKGYVWSFTISEPGLLAHWRLDENEGDVAYDNVGEKDGTLHGNPLWQPESGMVDGAVELDGIDDYIRTPRVLETQPDSFSVFAWIKGGMPGQVIFSQINRSNWLSTDSTDGSLQTALRFLAKPDITLQSQTVITDDFWHRVGLVWDGSNRILYVDDVEVASDIYGAGLLMGDLLIGAGSKLEAGTFWSGLIDDVRIYDRAVTP